jgi:predicted PurR-regulated permease PerM
MQRVFFIALVALFVYLIYLIFSPFLVPLGWAVVFTIMFLPVHQRIRRRIRGANRAALLSTLLLTAVIIIPGLFVLGAFTVQAVETAQWAQNQWREGGTSLRDFLERTLPLERILDWLAERNISEEEVTNLITQKLQQLAGFIAAQTGRMLRNLVFLFFDLFVTLFATFYLFRDGGAMLHRLRRALPLDDTVREGLFYIAQNVLYASVFSGLVVAAVQGGLGGLLFWLVGLGAPVLWGIVMAFLSLLPVVGAWMVWVPAAIYLLVTGEYVKAVVLLAAGAVIISMVDNVLRPILLSGRAQMNGLLVFISILGGIAAFGLLGIVLGPILVALATALLEFYTMEEASSFLPVERPETPPAPGN